MNVVMAILAAVTLTVGAANDEAVVQETVKSGDEVIVDGKMYVLLDKDGLMATTQALEARLDAIEQKMRRANGSEEGRVMFHGKRGHTVITNGIMRVTYADGYVAEQTNHQYKVDRFDRPYFEKADSKIKVVEPKVTLDMPEELKAIIERRKLASKQTNIVTRVSGIRRRAGR